MVKVVEKPLRQINTFRDLESSVANTSKSMRDARDRVRELAAEVGRAENPSKQLQEAYKASVRELERLGRVEAVQINQLSTMRQGLRAAGVDTRNLAAEQSRLSAEYAKALAAGRNNAALSSAKSTLGVGAVRETQQELIKLRQQYALVTSSGELSSRELGVAQANYRRSVSETLAKLRELRAASRAPAAAPDTSVATARKNLGVDQYRALRTQLTALAGDYAKLTRQGVLSAQERAVAEANYRRKVDETKRAIADLSSASGRSGGGLTVGGALGIAGGVGAATAVFSEYTKASDSVKKMDAQLRLATQSQTEFNIAQSATREIATRSQAPLADVVTLYSRLSPALSAMGRDQGDTLKVIDAVTQSLRISGATTSETSSTITQFSQALGSGVLRGEEFNSIAENSPRLLRAMAEGFKVPIGQLRVMAAAGQLTSEAITQVVIDALPQLQKEAAILPETVGGAFTVMGDKITLALGSVDTKPLIDQIKHLGDTIADPTVASNLNRLGAVVLKFGETIPKGLSGLVSIGDDIGYMAAKATGQVSPLEKVEKDINAAKEALKGFNISTLFTADDDTIVNMLYSKESLEAKLKEFEAYRAKLLEEATGLNAEQRTAQQTAVKDAATANDQRAEADRKRVEQLKKTQTDLLKAAKEGIKNQLTAEKKATADLKKAKDQQIEDQKQYIDAIAALQNGGTSGEASYGNAQALKVSAKQSLASGDVEGAKKNAQASLDVIKRISEAGGNTLGFAGFIKELQGIVKQAGDKDVKKAEDGKKTIEQKLADLREEAAKLKDLQITPVISDDAIAAILKQFQDIRVKLGLAFDVPMNLQATPEQMQTMSGKSANPLKYPTAEALAATAPEAQLDNPPTPPVPATSPKAPALKYQPGVTDYSQESISAPVEPVLADDYRQKMVEQVVSQGPVPVTVAPAIADGAIADLGVPVTPVVDLTALDTAKNQIAAFAELIRQSLTVAVTVLGADGGGGDTQQGSATLPGYAAGDLVKGPGTATSDSILARLSNGEFVMQAAAVRHYGPELLRKINERRLPRFASGGEVGRSLPNIPAPGEALLNRLNPPEPQSFGSVSFTVGGDTYQLQAPQQEFDRIIRNQRLKFGKS
ncbi:tape measure protein [Pseudomonas huanghezhanensis]|uniref:tape measure protein n=1 Tax=Pseudomonas huanghezhanensis TaxID=3002903 RepID=UPI002285D991|nr:tape measure protein [Pseudomonas sp. BSw22131]